MVYDTCEPMGSWTKTLLGASALAFILVAGTATAYAHGGRTDANGCHKNSKTGKRHCHGSKKPATSTQRTTSGNVYYANCTAARAAGAAPIRRGEPGYGRHLDRDGDGVACE